MNQLLRFIFICFTALLLATWAHAEVFKWVDAQGNIHYSDKKPENQSSEEIKIKSHTPDLSYQNISENDHSTDSKETDKPYKKKQKVTMYSASWCGYCKKARAYFQDNKIRYAEYDIEKNLKAKQRYEQLGGTGVPLLVAKRKQMQGFSKPRFERWYNDL
jgi:glutaredoxin